MWWKALLVSAIGLVFLSGCSCVDASEYLTDVDQLQLLEKALFELDQEKEAEEESHPYSETDDVAQDYGERMFRDRKEGQISVYNYGPSIRDQEYLEHSSLWGHQYMAGGAGEGLQRLKPDGSGRNIQVVKSDAILPAYCNPPNPCPIGYTSDDGCLEDFVNTAAFCREYQQQQECMCDTEHMFDCPGATKDDEVNTLAQQISNEGLVESALDRIVHKIDGNNENSIPVEGEHKSLVAKKFFNKETHAEYTRMLSEKNRSQEQRAKSRTRRAAAMTGKGPKKAFAQSEKKRNVTAAYQKKAERTKVTLNPYLQGEKLPVVAKKG